MSHLEQLPDHQHFKHGADAARHDDEGVGRNHEMLKPRKSVLCSNACSTKGLTSCLKGSSTRMPMEPRRAPDTGRTLVGYLHQARATASNDVTPHACKRGGDTLDLLVLRCRARRAREPKMATR